MTNINYLLYFICGLAGGIASALLVYYLSVKDSSLDRKILGSCFIVSIIGFFLGAHLLFFIVGLPSFPAKYGNLIYDVPSFIDSFFSASSGMVYYGGLFGAALALAILCKSRHIYGRLYYNVSACVFPLLLAFGRIGCSLYGCCYGREYHGPLAIYYSTSHINPGISDHIADFSRFPVQPMESLLQFITCFVLVKIFLKTRDKYPLLPIYFIIYGIIRFSDEFLRGDEIRGFWGPLSTSQWIALFSVIISALYIISLKRKRLNTQVI